MHCFVKRIYNLALFTLFVGASAQAGTLGGIVLDDSTSRPLPGADVRLSGTRIGTAADLDGRFTLPSVPPGEWKLEISHVGYATVTRPVAIHGDALLVVSIRMKANAVKLNEVVYTATRTEQLLKDVPVSTELVTRSEMDKSVALTAADALESQIGVDVREDFSGQGVMLQGVDPQRVLILVDGNRVIGRINGSIDLDQISTQGIRQIEVVKGAISTLYGSEAIGGVINVITADPVDPLRLDVDLTGGGWLPSGSSAIGARTANPAVDFSWKRGAVGIRGGLQYENNGIMDIDPSTPQTEGTAQSERSGGNLRADVNLSPTTTLILSGRLLHENQVWLEDTGIPGINLVRDDEELNVRNELSAELTGSRSWADRYSVKLYRSTMYHNWAKYTQQRHRRLDLSRNQEDYNQVSLQLTRTVHPAHRLTLGADAYLWGIKARTEMTLVDGGTPALNVDDFSSDLNAWDGFAQDEWTVARKWMLVPGVRYERHQIYGENISPRFSVMWSPTEAIRVRASAGKGYRAPSAKELYFTFNHSSVGYEVIGNPNLQPETSTNLDLSLEHTVENRSTSRISVFYNDLRSLIDFDSLTSTDTYYVGIYQYENITSAWTAGVELEQSFRLFRHLDMRGGYSYLATHNRETGGSLLRRPAHTARWELTWTPPQWSVRVWGRYIGKSLFQDRFNRDSQTSDEYTEPYSIWSLAVSRRFSGGMTLIAKVDNLLDTVNPRYGPFQGRIATIGWRWSWVPKLGA